MKIDALPALLKSAREERCLGSGCDLLWPYHPLVWCAGCKLRNLARVVEELLKS